jgi:hypothetical protein
MVLTSEDQLKIWINGLDPTRQNGVTVPTPESHFFSERLSHTVPFAVQKRPGKAAFVHGRRMRGLCSRGQPLPIKKH